mmetsp:Transcript_35454/g.63237  ORF Transcript_35454/g.63237 Transcript_35454/m.63237 type:complete len:108 (-) Transcript_35454:1364-1687(-)|eukprot:CAMPEP_0177763034 /NCGR_PEP_ID=MMETSP0491_2-20121128/6656_1 /TAXON_ID=63592 /ORGANISM="Tetraselmis chuii, Strain PLY429" /LENGTH=107 /DNA_ID=CAMNT_0019279115 /DNA_START=156 /DNA_END=479 /DNA_ORIENTATION=-
MDETALAAFESRAKAAEERLNALEERLSSGGGTAGPSQDTSKYAAALEEVRAVLVTSKAHQEELQAKYDEAVESQKTLETENSKLRYQVLHLKRAVEEGDAKLAAAS